MDSTTQPVNYKEKLEDQIVDMMLVALEKEEISEYTMSLISTDVISTIDSVKDKQTATAFLEKLCEKWPLFNPLLQMEKNELRERIEDEVADGVLVLLEHGKIENAIKLAKSVTKPNQVQQ